MVKESCSDMTFIVGRDHTWFVSCTEVVDKDM